MVVVVDGVSMRVLRLLLQSSAYPGKMSGGDPKRVAGITKLRGPSLSQLFEVRSRRLLYTGHISCIFGFISYLFIFAMMRENQISSVRNWEVLHLW